MEIVQPLTSLAQLLTGENLSRRYETMTEETMPMKSIDAILEGLDPDQRRAAEAIRGPVCIIAGAGTGKTRTITHRIAYAVAAGVTDPTKVLALTFTAKAAGEMRTRLRSLGYPGVAARTFHSAALKQLMYFWPYALGGAFPSLLPSKSGALAQAVISADSRLTPTPSRLRDLAAEIEWAKVSEIAPDQYVERALEAGRLKDSANKKIDLEDCAKIYEAYETLKRIERVIDFEDVLLLTVGMIEEDRQVRERIRDQYRYFTVDEYQDVSPLQQRLLNLWLGNREEICVVGDPAQTIYSFAGATSTFLTGFTKRFPQAQVIYLNRGYRSTPEIIRAANTLMDPLTPAGSERTLSSVQAAGQKPIVLSFSTVAAEIQATVTKVRELLAAGTSERDIAVLARTNSQLDLLEKAFTEAGITTQLKSTERFFDRVDVRDVMRVIRSSSVLPTEDWRATLDSILLPFLPTHQGQSTPDLASLGARGSSPRPDFIQAIVNFADEQKASGIDSMRGFLRELEDRAEQNNPLPLPGIILATLHAAKGLEWPTVLLVGVSEGILPMGSDIDEERRLFYVGLTRARERVLLSYAGAPSPFLEEIRHTLSPSL
jgi:DNA helicase II / ATP-dependent DNA helicase PcrA